MVLECTVMQVSFRHIIDGLLSDPPYWNCLQRALGLHLQTVRFDQTAQADLSLNIRQATVMTQFGAQGDIVKPLQKLKRTSLL
jgi:hypothetical protein